MSRPFNVGSYVHGPLFISALKTANLITDDKFSFFIATNPTASFVDIGKQDNSHMKNPANAKTINLSNNFFWLVTIPAVKVGTKEGKITEYNAIFDTGTSLMYIPAEAFDLIMGKLMEGRKR